MRYGPQKQMSLEQGAVVIAAYLGGLLHSCAPARSAKNGVFCVLMRDGHQKQMIWSRVLLSSLRIPSVMRSRAGELDVQRA